MCTEARRATVDVLLGSGISSAPELAQESVSISIELILVVYGTLHIL
jgi:hypothetical protein